MVIPTYCEAENIGAVVAALGAAVPAADVVVVDDGSPDGTADLAEAAGARVLRRPGKAGLGTAYAAGFGRGIADGYEVLVQMDADFQHDPSAVPALLAAIDDGADMAIGSRYVPGGALPPSWPWFRRALSRGGNRYARVMLRLPVADATAGFRAHRAELLRRLQLAEMRADGYGFQIELTWRAARAGARIVEVPIVFGERTRGTSKMSLRIVAEAMWLVSRWGLIGR